MTRRVLLLLVAALFAVNAAALYDAKPEQSLADLQGEWKGALVYRDYQEPHGLVTLPTRLFVALGAPNALVLHYVFDDGPGKTVYSYERMTFDFAAHEVTWLSGSAKPLTDLYRITADTTDGGVRTLVFEGKDGDKLVRFTLQLAARAMSLGKEELDAQGAPVFRDKYTFARL
jgi:hypothetical protein